MLQLRALAEERLLGGIDELLHERREAFLELGRRRVVGEVHRRAQVPVQTGSRFSRNAATPSFASCELCTTLQAICSITISDSVSASRPRLSVSFVIFMQKGLLSARSATKSATHWSSSAAGADLLARFHSGLAASLPESSLPVSMSSFDLRMPMMRGSR